MTMVTTPNLTEGPRLATTSLRPVAAPLRPTIRNWPELGAMYLIFLVLMGAIWPAGTVDPLHNLGAACVIFGVSICLCMFSSLSPMRGTLTPNGVILLPGIAIAFAALQTVAGYMGRAQVASLAPSESLLATLRIASYLALFICIRWSVTQTKTARQLALALFGYLAFVGAVSLLYYDPKLSSLTHPGLPGPFANRSAFATLMGIGLCIGAAFATQGPHPRVDRPVFLLFRACCIMGCALLFLAILQSQSRLGLVSSCAAVSAILVLRARAHALLWVAGGVALTVAVLTSVQLDIMYRFQTMSQDAQLRQTLYAQVWTMIMDRPMIGQGAGTFATRFEHFHTSATTAAFVWDRAHSTLLTLWAELGLLFGSLVPLAGISCAIAAHRRYQRTGQAHTLATVAVLVLASVHALADFSLEFPAIAYLVTALTALGLGPISYQKKDASQ